MFIELVNWYQPNQPNQTYPRFNVGIWCAHKLAPTMLQMKLKKKFMFMLMFILMFLYSFEWCILHKLQNSENESDVWTEIAHNLNLIG
jgi:hypothetical protein